MRPVTFSADPLRQFLRRNRIATLPQLKQVLGTDAAITVFRKLKELACHTSYSHRGQFYTLAEIADFDENGLWTFDSVWFSRHGTLLNTAEAFVNQAPAGCFAAELEEFLHVPVKEPLLHLVRQDRISRLELSQLYLYCASDKQQQGQQLLARQARLEQPGVSGNMAQPEQISDELRAASSCSGVHSTNSNGVCTPAWSRSSWVVAETIRLRNFFNWTRTRWPGGDANW